jgi:hypothetical protein
MAHLSIPQSIPSMASYVVEVYAALRRMDDEAIYIFPSRCATCLKNHPAPLGSMHVWTKPGRGTRDTIVTNKMT